ncbi:hypothetical protein [Streptomyces triticagri]|uniref:hypothetical protein n=1 Tax=Streptomyces triticagri TaxID=2293568 RepID=UPI000FFC5AAC|nr:hypothetical protein [Streptomyces triticagri]
MPPVPPPLPALPSGVLADAAEALGWVIEDMADDLGSRPTLEELLTVLGWGVPADGDGFADGPYEQPFPFAAGRVGGRAYRPGRPAETEELGDAAFAQSADLLDPVLSAATTAAGCPITRHQLVDAVTQLLHTLAASGTDGEPLTDATRTELGSVVLRQTPADTLP